jgi:hypothetical protein
LCEKESMQDRSQSHDETGPNRHECAQVTCTRQTLLPVHCSCPLMCGFKRKQATFLVGRCAHSLTHSHSPHSLTQSLLWTLIIHSLFTHSLTEMRACMSPACAGIGMESMVARMRHGCVSPCGPRPTWRPRAACVAVRNRVWRPPAPPTAHARAAHSEPRAPRPTGRAGGGAPGPPPLLCLVASCDVDD